MSETHSTFSFTEAEHQVLAFWQQHRVFQQSLEQTKDKPVYTFYDGPPFATGLPHHGHLLASTIKDIIARYQTMNGRYVERRFGWDCHGLPVEYEIDKKLGKPTYQIVAERGLKAYNQECRDIVQRYTQQWRSTITRIGRWVDFDNDYKTMNPNFMESVWWVFKQLWEKDLIYQGTKVVPFSTALGTVLSNFEAGSNYQDVQDPAITVLLKLDDEDSHIAIWTTTPWTLPSNLGACVNPNFTYIKVHDEDKGKTFYIAKERLEAISKNKVLTVISECSGQELIGKSYQPLFPYFSELQSEGAFKILGDDFVTTEDGTGIVHMAPAFGEDDARIMTKAGVTTLVCPVDDNGNFTDEVSDYAGQYVKDADKQIMKDLKAKDALYDQSTLVHSYPFCPRSDTPLIYRAIPSWYIKVESLKQKLIANNEKINWIPNHIKHGRFGKWLAGARDWAISRNRVWGTPMPLWMNTETQDIICIGSINELEKLTGENVTDLHRDSIDSLTFSIPNQPGQYQRIPEVLDCWFESGSMPYAQQHYPFQNKQQLESGFPADFIAEGLDQTRGWFYTLTVIATALFDQPAFKNVIVNGIVMTEDGKKMSKRLKNYTPPDTLMETYGADALRLYLINSGLVKAEEQRFSDSGVKDMVRRTLLPWYNAFKFLHTYASVDKWQPDQQQQDPEHILDHWIISRLQSLKKLIHTHMQAYQLYMVVPELLLFIDDLTNIYIRLNRPRFWTEDMQADKRAAYSTLCHVIQELCVCMAPFAPFLAETLYQKIRDLHANKDTLPLSVHLCDFPQAEDTLINRPLESGVERLQQILILGRKKRNDVKIKIKTPLKKLIVINKDTALLEEIKKLEPIIKKELNVKQVEYSAEENHYITLYAKPNSPRLGKRLHKRFGQFRKHLEALTHQQIEQLEQQGEIEIEGETFTPEDILIFREAKAGCDAITNRYISIVLDTQLDQALIDEGLAREVINRIQKTRKELDLNVDDRIHIGFDADEYLQNIIQTHQEYICRETLSLSLKPQKIEKADFKEEIDTHTLALALTIAKSE